MGRPGRASSPHKCSLCAKSFQSEFKLLLHFQEKHITPMVRDNPGSMALLEEESEADGQEEAMSTEESEEEDLSSLDDHTCFALLCAGNFLFRKPPPTVPKTEIEPADGPLETREVKRRRRRLNSEEEEERENLICIFCNKEFKPYQKARFNYHLRTHTKEKPYFCEYCDECFARPNYLTKHMRIHMNANQFPCPLCDLGFTEVSYMKTHLRTHTLKKSVKCEVCGEGFYDKNKLNRHMLTHTKKKFECTQCKRKFGRADSLKRHMIKMHNPDKPHKCRVCSEEFYHPDVLVMHMNLMHGRKKDASKPKKKFKSAEFILSD